jgi:hypothetical protein
MHFGAVGIGATIVFGAIGLMYGSRTLTQGVIGNRHAELTEEHLSYLARTMPEASRPRILVIGNSATMVSGFLDHLSENARDAGSDATIVRASAGGARLVETLSIPALRDLLQDVSWDTVVLQDHSSTPLDEEYRAASLATIQEVAKLAFPASIVLFPHWPSEFGNRSHGGGLSGLVTVPIAHEEYTKLAREHYSAAAQATGGQLAPVLENWISALEAGEDLYSPDAHHANDTGAKLAADAVWQTLSENLGLSAVE